MTRYYCDYCDAHLTHDSTVVRHQHNTGFKHRANVRNYFAQFLLAQAITPGPVPGPGGGPAPAAYTASGPPRPGGGFVWRPPVRGPPGVSVYYPRGPPPPQGAPGGGGFGGGGGGAPGYQQQGFRPPFGGGPSPPPPPPQQQQQQGYFPPPPPLQ